LTPPPSERSFHRPIEGDRDHGKARSDDEENEAPLEGRDTEGHRSRGRRGGLPQAREGGRRNLVAVAHKELKKTGAFVLHGLAKFSVHKKPARPAREGINPFTKQKQKFAAKPASKAVRARPVKAVKDAVA
jgi:nucleoid DNA-binding protein